MRLRSFICRLWEYPKWWQLFFRNLISSRFDGGFLTVDMASSHCLFTYFSSFRGPTNPEQSILASLTSSWTWQWPSASLLTSWGFLSPHTVLITEWRKEANSILDRASVQRSASGTTSTLRHVSVWDETVGRIGRVNLGHILCPVPGLVQSDRGSGARLARKGQVKNRTR